MSVLSVVAVSQLDESFRGLGRGHGVVDISAAAVSAVPHTVIRQPLLHALLQPSFLVSYYDAVYMLVM